jgi:hypothetical protein
MQTFDIQIDYCEIVKQVRNETHKFGKGRDNGSLTPQQVSNLQADEMPQDNNIVANAVRSATQRIVVALSKHIQSVENNYMGDGVVITFTMSRYYNPASNGLVEDGVKAFVKDMAIYEYLKLVAPNDARQYQSNAMVRLSETRTTLNYKRWHRQSQ